MGGPDGGGGGRGGDVIIEARSNLRAMGHLEHVWHVRAGAGANGRGKDQTGKSAKVSRVLVPVGTVIWEIDEDDPEKKVQLADLTVAGDDVVVAQGGRGGRGNDKFVSATNQEPLLAEGGEEGVERQLLLEVKMLADVALIGAPNAGKSTLLSVISRAKPKIANYPFTTIEPLLGVAEHRGRDLVFIDVPGLIEGAHLGKGLGLEFLRHAERVQVLVHLIDGTEEDWVGEYRRITAELQAYPGGLSEKPRLLAVNKMDITEVRERAEAEGPALAAEAGQEPHWISGATGEGLAPLLDAVLPLVPTEMEADRPPRRTEIPKDEPRAGVQIERDGELFIVHCAAAERYIPAIDLSNWRTQVQYHQELKRLKVIAGLERAGVEAGDTVRIGSHELEWE